MNGFERLDCHIRPWIGNDSTKQNYIKYIKYKRYKQKCDKWNALDSVYEPDKQIAKLPQAMTDNWLECSFHWTVLSIVDRHWYRDKRDQ